MSLSSRRLKAAEDAKSRRRRCHLTPFCWINALKEFSAQAGSLCLSAKLDAYLRSQGHRCDDIIPSHSVQQGCDADERFSP